MIFLGLSLAHLLHLIAIVCRNASASIRWFLIIKMSNVLRKLGHRAIWFYLKLAFIPLIKIAYKVCPLWDRLHLASHTTSPLPGPL